jgi:hypothetical protein
LWEGRYRASLVEAEAYLLACYRYIELNPVRAGMVQDLVEYPWSSSRWHALGQPDSVITDHALYLALGSEYRKFKRPFPPTARPTLAPTPRHRKPPPSRSPVREARDAAWQAARRSPPAQGRRLRPRSEDWCKRLRLAVAMGLQTSGTVVMGRLQPSGTRGGASTLRSENAEG